MSSLTMARSQVTKIQKDIADLRSKEAAEAKKEADLSRKWSQAIERANRASSASSTSSNLRDAQRAQNDAASTANRRAEIVQKIASKSKDLTREQDRVTREEESVRRKLDAADKKRLRHQQEKMASLERKIASHSAVLDSIVAHVEIRVPENLDITEMFDVFISHASEDKTTIVQELADKLEAAGLKIWYDEISMKWGDGLRRSIDNGLKSSKFGLVILTPNFFKKEWTQRELDGLTQMELVGKSRILPIWHKVTKDEVAAFSPTLADKLAISTANFSLAEIVDELLKLVDK